MKENPQQTVEFLSPWVSYVGQGLEGTGVAIIVLGAVYSFGYFFINLQRLDGKTAYAELRQMLGRSILLGLEFLVAGDIIRTVAVHPTLTSVGVLAIIVLIRTFLSFTLEVELEGHWPWQRGSRTARTD